MKGEEGRSTRQNFRPTMPPKQLQTCHLFDTNMASKAFKPARYCSCSRRLRTWVRQDSDLLRCIYLLMQKPRPALGIFPSTLKLRALQNQLASLGMYSLSDLALLKAFLPHLPFCPRAARRASFTPSHQPFARATVLDHNNRIPHSVADQSEARVGQRSIDTQGRGTAY